MQYTINERSYSVYCMVLECNTGWWKVILYEDICICTKRSWVQIQMSEYRITWTNLYLHESTRQYLDNSSRLMELCNTPCIPAQNSWVKFLKNYFGPISKKEKWPKYFWTLKYSVQEYRGVQYTSQMRWIQGLAYLWITINREELSVKSFSMIGLCWLHQLGYPESLVPSSSLHRWAHCKWCPCLSAQCSRRLQSLSRMCLFCHLSLFALDGHLSCVPRWLK